MAEEAEVLRITCASCGAGVRAKEEQRGKRFACPRCKEPMEVPVADDAAPEAPAPAPRTPRRRGASRAAGSSRARRSATRDDASLERSAVAEPLTAGRVGGSLAAGLGAGVVGALVWATIMSVTGYEVGYVAWAVGGLVGFLMALTGAAGAPLGAAAALITLLAVGGGKWVGTRWLMDEGVDEWVASEPDDLAVWYYDELKQDAALLAMQPDDLGDDALTAFLLDRNYRGDPETGLDLDDFRANWLPMLEALHTEQPSYEDWREDEIEAARGRVGEESALAYVVEDLTGLDAVFAALALSTAFGLVRRREVE